MSGIIPLTKGATFVRDEAYGRDTITVEYMVLDASKRHPSGVVCVKAEVLTVDGARHTPLHRRPRTKVNFLQQTCRSCRQPIDDLSSICDTCEDAEVKAIMEDMA